MAEQEFLAREFEANRRHLRAVARRMLGSAAEADDAVQEAWVRLSRTDVSAVLSLKAWLTTVVARLCLDMLRARKARREELVGSTAGQPILAATAMDPHEQAELAESVGLALLLVLATLDPAERVAFVLHDMFDLPFDEIAPIVGRSTDAARQLASRARRLVRSAPAPDPDFAAQRTVVEAFMAASRARDLDALLAVLDPDIVLRADAVAIAAGTPAEIRGADAVARNALAGRGRGGSADFALIDGVPGLLVVAAGQLKVALLPTIALGRITAIEAIADPDRLRSLNIRVAGEGVLTGLDASPGSESR